MLFRNVSKRNMYLLLKSFNKHKDIYKTQEFVCKKLKLDEASFANIVSECVLNHFFDGIETSSSASNLKHNVYSEHIYITYNGYEFLKNYYTFLKRIVWELFLIITTAFITVAFTNWLPNSNHDADTFQDFISNKTRCVKICDEPNN